MWFPPLDELVAIHHAIVSRTAGTGGVLRIDAVRSAIARARWGPFADGGDLAERAALLLRGMVLDHPFVDGNKRTAFAAADLFLRRNGCCIEASELAVLAFMLSVADGDRDVSSIAEWLRRRLGKVDEGNR